jgi:hypothetical protein
MTPRASGVTDMSSGLAERSLAAFSETCGRDHGFSIRPQRSHRKGKALMTIIGILDALTKRLVELGHDPATARPHARSMMTGWEKFVDYDSQETGGRQCESWMDAEVVRLLDASLIAHNDDEPFPR